MMSHITFLFFIYVLFFDASNRHMAGASESRGAKNQSHPNIHAIIVSSSRYWFNYRHAMNALGMYEIYRQNGIPDENIILMIADEYAINARNPYKNRMHAEGIHRTGWYNNRTEIDYRGSDVTIQNFMDSLLGLAPKSLDNLNAESNLFIYVAGHGGDQFFKFQDEEELTSQDIANLMDRLYEEKKFKKALFIAETCQAFTLFDKITTPDVLCLGTSLIDESAYAHHSDENLGLSVIERWTHYFLDYYHSQSGPKTTLYQTMVAPFADKNVLFARVGIKDDTSQYKFKGTLLSEFFGTKGASRYTAHASKQPPKITEVQLDGLREIPENTQVGKRPIDFLQDTNIDSENEERYGVCRSQDESCFVEKSQFRIHHYAIGFVLTFGLLRLFEKGLIVNST